MTMQPHPGPVARRLQLARQVTTEVIGKYYLWWLLTPTWAPPVLSINGEEQEGARRRKVKQVDLPVGIWPLPAARHAARLPPMSQPVHSLPVDC